MSESPDKKLKKSKFPKERTTRNKKADSQSLILAKQKLWSDTGIEFWIDFLKRVDPTRTWAKAGSHDIKALCPFHSESTPSFFIKLADGRARCFGCGVHFHDPITFLSQLNGTSYRDMLDRVVIEFPRIPSFLKEEKEIVEERHQLDVLKNQIYRISKECMRDAKEARKSANIDKIEEYKYAESTLNWLDLRRIPEDYWDKLSIGILPTEAHLKKYMCEFIQQPLLLDKALEYLKVTYDSRAVRWYGGLVLAYHSTPTQVARFKLRLPDDRASTQTGAQLTRFIDEENPSEYQGYFGLESCKGIRTEGLIAYVVEGEFDQMSIQLAALGAFKEEGFDTSPHTEVVVATGGTYHPSLDDLKAQNFVEVRVIADNPRIEGYKYPLKVISSTTLDFKIKIYLWPDIVAAAKDPDKAIHMFNIVGPRTFLSSIYNTEHFLEQLDWILERLKEDVKANKRQDDDEYIISRIQEYSSYVTSEIAKGLLTTAASDFFNVDKSVLTRALVKSSSSEYFIQELVNLFQRDFAGISARVDGGLTKVLLFHRGRREQYELHPSRQREAVSSMGIAIGSAYEWVDKNIGIPGFIRDCVQIDPSKPPRAADYKAQVFELDFYLSMALTKWAASIPSDARVERKKEGIHIFEKNGSYVIYFNNGGHLFKGSYQEVEGEKHHIEWEELQDPIVDNHLLFDVSTEAWSRNVDVADINIGETVNLKEMFDSLVEMLHKAWTFENGILDAQVIAAFMMVCPIASIFPKRPALFVTAEKSSGKSKLTIGLMGSDGLGDIPGLIEHSSMSVNTTQAGIYQSMDGNPMLFILDEFEDSDESGVGAYNNARIWQILRSAQDGGMILRGRAGGAEKGVRKLRVRFPFVLSAINLTDNDANISRIIPIIMKHDPNHASPGLTLSALHPQSAYYEDFAKKLTVASLSHVPNFMKLWHQMYTKYLTMNAGDLGSTRFIEGMLPMLALMNYMGMDELAFLKDFSESKARFLKRFSKSDTDDVFHAVMNTPYVFGPMINAGLPSTLADLLAMRADEDGDYINQSAAGAYYLKGIDSTTGERYNWLLLKWDVAMHSLMKNNNQFREFKPDAMSEKARRSSFVIPDSKLPVILEAMKREKITRGHNFNISRITVYNIEKYLTERDMIIDSESELM